MREEVLRMERILCENGQEPELNYLSLQIFKGEVYGVLCLERSGIDRMVDLICFNGPLCSGQVFFGEKLVNSAEESTGSRNKVMVIGRQSRLIDGLTLADNLFVIREGFKKRVIPERVIEQETARVFEELHISLSPDMLVEELGAYHRLVVEVLKAVISGDKLIVLWEISDLLSSEELPRFHSLIRRLAGEGNTFLYIYSHHEVLRPVCDRIAIFKGNTIQKVLTVQSAIREQIQTVYARHTYERIMKLRPNGEEQSRGREVLRLDRVAFDKIHDLSFSVYGGENVLLLDQSNTILDELTELLLGNKRPADGQILPSPAMAARERRIAVIQRDAVRSMLFPEMSYLENLCFPLAEKVPFFWQRPKLKRSVLREYREEIGPCIGAGSLYGLTQKELYTLVYYRYLIAKPDLVICVQPLSDTDMYLRTHIAELLSRLRNTGIAVLVLNTELYDTLYIADRLIRVEQGRVIAQVPRERFDEARMTQEEIFPD